MSNDIRNESNNKQESPGLGKTSAQVTHEAGDNEPRKDITGEANNQTIVTDQHVERYKYIPENFEKNMEFLTGAKPECFTYLKGWSTWEITDLKSLHDGQKHRGPVFTIGKMDFNILLTTSNSRDGFVCSLFLEGHPHSETDTKDPDWSCPVQFTFDLWDSESKNHKAVTGHHRYDNKNTDWGFPRALSSETSFGNLVLSKDRINVTAYVSVFDDYTKVLFHNFINYDSKKLTGYVGINNQGATCYLNSLLQSYFFTRNFRDKVYQIPTEDEISFDFPTYSQYLEQPKSVPLSLQRIFYKLQTADAAIDSIELTKSFGWTSADAFEQHDVQELNRILMDKLETKMKGTDIEGCLNDIFVGKMNSFIRCVNVDYESSRTEDFWDIQLNVKGLKGIKESFDDYVALEMLAGENKYDAAGFGLQTAEKGVIFESFPPILHIQLKRYEYDFNYDQMVKINDRYEFTSSIDLKPYLSKSVDNYDDDWEYELHGVLVHQGDVSVGHYYAMIKPDNEDKWFKFEDERVSRVTEYQVFDENFGCNKKHIDTRNMTREEAQMLFWKQSTSAYMLVYIRKSMVDEVLKVKDEAFIPSHVEKQIEYEREMEQQIEKEKREMHLYANIELYTNNAFTKYEGFDIGPNATNKMTYTATLNEEDTFPLKFKILKSENIDNFFNIVAESVYGEDYDKEKLQDMRFWKMSCRNDDAFRPSAPINCRYGIHDDIKVDDICKLCERKRYQGCSGPTNISLYLEDLSQDLNYLFNAKSALIENSTLPENLKNIEDYNDKVFESAKLLRKSFNPSWDAYGDNKHILLFIKYFDEESQVIKGLGSMIVSYKTTFSTLSKKMAILLDLDPTQPIDFKEELNSDAILKKRFDETLRESELQTGDILCFNKLSKTNNNKVFKDQIQRYNFLSTRRHFRIFQNEQIDENEEDYIDSESEITENVSDEEEKQSDFDLWISYQSSYRVITEAIAKRTGHDPDKIRLWFMNGNSKTSLKSDFKFDIFHQIPQSETITLVYEILNISVKELEELKNCTVFWIGSGICKDERHDFSVPRSTTVNNLLDRLQTKIQFKEEDRDALFVWTVSPDHRFKDLCQLDDTIDVSSVFVVGCYPEFKKVFDERPLNETLITGFHFFHSPENYHSLPFIFRLIEGEPFLDMCLRLKEMLGVSEQEFKNIHIGIYNETRVDYFDPKKDVKPFTVFQEGYSMVLNHPDRHIRRGSTQSSIVIKG